MSHVAVLPRRWSQSAECGGPPALEPGVSVPGRLSGEQHAAQPQGCQIHSLGCHQPELAPGDTISGFETVKYSEESEEKRR